MIVSWLNETAHWPTISDSLSYPNPSPWGRSHYSVLLSVSARRLVMFLNSDITVSSTIILETSIFPLLYDISKSDAQTPSNSNPCFHMLQIPSSLLSCITRGWRSSTIHTPMMCKHIPERMEIEFKILLVRCLGCELAGTLSKGVAADTRNIPPAAKFYQPCRISAEVPSIAKASAPASYQVAPEDSRLKGNISFVRIPGVVSFASNSAVPIAGGRAKRKVPTKPPVRQLLRCQAMTPLAGKKQKKNVKRGRSFSLPPAFARARHAE